MLAYPGQLEAFVHSNGLVRHFGFIRKVWQVLGLGPRYGITFVLPSSNTMAAIGKLMAEGKLKAVIDRVLPLEDARYVTFID